MFSNARERLDGPPFALPSMLDRLAERWWRARPRTRVLLAVSVAALILAAAAASSTASPHGPPASAWVASRDLVVGETLGTDVLERATWPDGLLPDDALTEPLGTLAAPLPRGAVATDRHLGDAGLAAGLPPGISVVPVPVDALPSLPSGAIVDVVANDVGGGPGRLVAGDATVLRTDEAAIWIAVDDGDAADLAAATLHGSLGVVLTGG